MIRKLESGSYRLYSRKKNPKTGKRRNLGTFPTLEKAKEHEHAVQYFKRHRALTHSLHMAATDRGRGRSSGADHRVQALGALAAH
jgi:hypothetical protein